MIAGNLRGIDGCGIFSVHKFAGHAAAKDIYEVQMMKKMHNSFHLWFDKSFSDYMKVVDKDACIVFGHNRAATRGKLSDENTHPFETKNLTLIHNGTISYGLGDYAKLHEVDSGGLAHMIDEKGIEYAAENVEMAYALVWYDKRDNTLHFCRNKERPLWVAETANAFYYASEKLMLEWILSRNDILITKMMEVPINQHFTIDVATGEMKNEELPVKKTYTTVGYTSYTNSTASSHTQVSEEDINKKFKELSYWLNKELDFYLTSCKDIGSNKRVMLQYRGYSVSATAPVVFRTKSEVFKEFLTTGTFRGIITSIEKVDGSVCLIVKAKTIKKRTDSKVTTVGNNKVITMPDFSDIGNDDDLTDDDVVEMGDGTLITVAIFKQRAEVGCGHCGAKIDVKDVEVMSRAPDNTILCGHCTAEAICDTEKFMKNFVSRRHVH